MRINSLILRDGVKFGALNRVNGAYHEVENIFSDDNRVNNFIFYDH